MQTIIDRDQAGDPIPTRARLQLDILLSLGGAGEPTFTADFAARLDELRQQQAAKMQEQQQNKPPPPRIAERLQSGMQALGSRSS